MQTLLRIRLGEHAARDAVPAVAMPGREIGYPELVARVDACAAELARAAWRPDEVAGLAIPDEPLHLVASLALASLGVPQMVLASHESVATRGELARRAGVRRVVLAARSDAPAGLDAVRIGDHASGPVRTAPPAVASRSPGAMPDFLFTSSGTTGRPKIFGWDQETMAWRAVRVARSERGTESQRTFVPHSIEHRAAQARRHYAACLGTTSILQAAGAPPLPTVALCAALRVTHLELSVVEASSLVLDDGARLPSGTIVHASGSPVPALLRQRFRERHGVPLHVHYGASEVGRITSTLDDPHAFEGPGDDNVGAPTGMADVELVDPDGRPVRRGEVGEIRTRAERMAREYVDDPVATTRHFRDGWFHPGDLGRFDAAGRLTLAGRADEMMNLAGIKIFPAEIERVLEGHPEVRAAAAFAQSSEIYGDIPVAAVELHRPGVASEQELLARARDALGVRAPRRILIVDALPRNAAGKVLKRELAALVPR